MASIVVTAATTAFIGITKHTTGLSRDIHLDDEAKMLMEVLLPEIQAAGGANVRPWMAVFNDNNAGINGSDVLWVSVLDTTFRECQITDMTTLPIEIEGTDTDNDSIPDACCLVPGNYPSHRVVITNPSNDSWFTVQPGAPVIAGPASGQCMLNAGALTPMAGLSNPALNLITDFPILSATPPGPYGTIGVVRTFRLFMNADNQLVRQEVITGGGGDLARVLSDEVYDFQVAFGYDAPPADGNIVDNGSTGDEWRYNSAGADDLGSGGLTAAGLTDLRMAKIAVVHGAADPDGTSAQVFDGPVVNGAALTDKRKLLVSKGSVSFRNLFLFQ